MICLFCTYSSVLDVPVVAPPTLTSDLCRLLKEGDPSDSVADIGLQVRTCTCVVVVDASTHAHTHTTCQCTLHAP